MSSANRRSIDSPDSFSSPLASHTSYPFPRIEVPPSQVSSPSGRSLAFRRGSNASISSFGSTTTSIGGSLDIRPSNSDAIPKEPGLNAISTLLQPPLLRTGLLPHTANVSPGYKAPTARDIPPVTLTNIPHVDPSAFKDYLSTVGPLIDGIKRQRVEKATKPSNATEDASAPGTPVGERFRPLRSRQGSLATLSPVVESPSGRRRSSGHGRRRANEPTPLSSVPHVYFEEDFHLENPRTFDVVSERAEIVRQPSTPGSENGPAIAPRKALATNAILQEKLSWYMDTVEIHLIESISTASSSFFAALGSLRDLQREAEESAEHIRKLRADLETLDKGMAQGGIAIARMRNRRRNIGKLFRAAQQLQAVVEQIIKCEELVDNGEFEAAADGIDATDRLIRGQADPATLPVINGDHQEEGELINLSQLQVLQSLSGTVGGLHARIGHGFETRFLETLMEDLRMHVKKVTAQETLSRWVDASRRQRGGPRLSKPTPEYLDTGPQFREALSSSLAGLSRSGYTGRAADSFRKAVTREVKVVVKKNLPSSNDEDAESVMSVATRRPGSTNQQEKMAILARNLRALDELDAEALLVGISTGVSETLRRLGVQIKVLLDITSTFERPRSRPNSRSSSPGPASPVVAPSSSGAMLNGHLAAPGSAGSQRQAQSLPTSHIHEDLVQALDMSSLLGEAVDEAQKQITRVLKVRAEQTHRLPMEQFVRYITMVRLFGDECEAISGLSGQALKDVLNTQLKAFVASMTEAEGQHLAQILESERWEAQDFPEKGQAILSRILDGMNSDPAIWTRSTRIWESATYPETNGQFVPNGGSKAEVAATTKSKAQVKPAYIDETRFVLVKSAADLLETLDKYLALIASVPGVAQTAVPALAEVLRTFNSRSSQLILGAGATRVAGLKNITTKHLALSSQALSFVIALVPYMREAVRRHTGGRNECLGEFDKVKRLMQDHQLGIHDKLVEIMSARARSHLTAMKKVDYDTDGGNGPSAYMETLTKETGTLYRVLNRHLQEGDVMSIMIQIGRAYKEALVPGFAETKIGSEKGKQRLLRDVELFDNKLGKIEGFGDLAKILVDGVKTRAVEEPKKEEVAAPAPEKREAAAVPEEKETVAPAPDKKAEAELRPEPEQKDEADKQTEPVAEASNQSVAVVEEKEKKEEEAPKEPNGGDVKEPTPAVEPVEDDTETK